MRKIGDMVGPLLKSLGLEGAYQEYQVLKEASELLPPSIRAVHFRKGTLFLESTSAAHRFAFTFEVENFRNALNARLEAPWVKRILILSPRRRKP